MDQNNTQHQYQQTPPPQKTPVAAPGTAQHPSKALAIWALVLSILSILTSIVFFVAFPLAVAALIMGIIALVKKKPGKGMSIASIVMGGLALLIFIPMFFAILLVAYNGVLERANEVESSTYSEEGQE